jgi:hypothetical protein
MNLKIRTRRVAMVGGLLAMSASLLLASPAFACTNLAELNIGPTAGPAGTQVTVTGSAFAHGASNSPVSLHWGAANGPVLATVQPDSGGAIQPMKITIPADATPGSYAIVATQTQLATGLTPWGLPARAGFTVSGQGAAAAPSSAVATGVSSSGASGGLIALTLALGLGGLLLFALGAATFVGTMRRRAVPSRVRN